MIIQWRNTADTPRLGPLDAKAVFPLFGWMLHMRLWTFALALGFIIFLVIIGKKGFPTGAACRHLLHYVRGKRRLVNSRSILRRRCRW